MGVLWCFVSIYTSTFATRSTQQPLGAVGGAGHCHGSLCAFLGGVINHRDLPLCAATFLGVASAEAFEHTNQIK